MSQQVWQSPEQLKKLLIELVSWESTTGSKGEQEFPIKLKNKLMQLEYFQSHPEHLTLHEADQGRHSLTALYKSENTDQTICMIGHHDTVPIEEYGDLKPLATKPDEITRAFLEKLQKNQLPFSERAKHDLQSGEYLFGRGTMDMKIGLALQMRLIEKASLEHWPINLLLINVPDEEVNSAGMRLVVPNLVKLQNEFGLRYILFMNSEPVFTTKPDDENFYVYSGSIGKILVGALFFGKETHAGEPLKGITSPYLASFLTQEMEWNPLFIEESLGETTPPPLVLQQKDLSLEYSTQTPYRSSALYNIFTMKRDAGEVFNLFESVAKTACEKLNKNYMRICSLYNVQPIGKVKTIRYSELVDYATEKYGKSLIENIKKTVLKHKEWDDREKSFRIAEKLMIECSELAPAIVILMAPPYYPSVNSTGNKLVEDCLEFFTKKAKERFKLDIHRIHYFNGICDLSYIHDNSSNDGWSDYGMNTPVYGETYHIPFTDMQKLNAPVMNIGPLGKDAHKLTERLHKDNAFKQMPVLLDDLFHMIISTMKKTE